ncbi:class I SAM-dependent methyltransferase [Helicobacter sp. 12S02634-8]|uniref:Eco57I restriction-modification methylase domain-containing protein n=1 Tax=Helicobacter sp. 12S02634-8 TaxID=1476199 RepID=UPI000BA5642A|nr:class I SAM-dependent methyltransferase [Helicobacter sp. 12S02634-8]
MLGLMENYGSILEPSCGNGSFLDHLPNHAIGIEIDPSVIKNKNVKNIDFFAYGAENKFDTIIGNPPYIAHKNIPPNTKNLLMPYKNIFDHRSNLYLFFIFKSILHLKQKGELIFITPRDFLKLTAATKLNHFLYQNGTITDFIDLGDKKIFDNAQPNCAIWRFEKNNFTRKTNILKNFNCHQGQITFTNASYPILFKDLFFVKVGAVSGNDKLFTHSVFGNEDFVCSHTCKTNKTKKMIYNQYHPFLEAHKQALINRKIRKFTQSNWWQWGRDYFKSDCPRIYVNTKTRNKQPFFIHPTKAYDGSILAIFPRFQTDSSLLKEICDLFNHTNWEELGFVCDGRFLFSQKSLENCSLGENFARFYSLKKL